MSSRTMLVVLTAFVAVTAISLSMPAFASTLLVNSTSGHDTGNCQINPCLTIAYAESQSAAGDTISLAAGTYRLTQGNSISMGEIAAKDNQIFTGPDCTANLKSKPPKACPAIVSGGISLGTAQNGLHAVSGVQIPPGNVPPGTGISCDPGWPACMLPEDLFIGGVPLQQIGYPLAGTFTYASVSGGSISGNGYCIATSYDGNGVGAVGRISITNGIPGENIFNLTSPNGFSTVPAEWTLSTGTATCTVDPMTGKNPIMTTTGGMLGTMPTLGANQWLFDYVGQTVHYNNSKNLTGALEISAQSTMFKNNKATGLTIENLTIEEFASQNVQGGAVDPTYAGTAQPAPNGATGWIVQNNYVTHNHGVGVRIGYGMQVLDNVLTMNGNFGVGGGTPAEPTPPNLIPSGVVVTGNTVTGNNYTHVLPDYGAGGIKFGNSMGVIVSKNTVTNNIGNAIHFDVNSINAVVDGNNVSGNVDTASLSGSGAGVAIEISEGATVRNNIIGYVGINGTVGLVSSTSTNVEAYCNVVEQQGTSTPPLMGVVASDRGNYTRNPNLGSQIVSTGNYFHHNTVIWDSKTNTGEVGYFLNDPNQPSFFSDNKAPNFNMYHTPSNATAPWQKFVYDDNSSRNNTALCFATICTGVTQSYQGNGADVNGTSTNNGSNAGYPIITITSPSGDTNGQSPITVQASGTNINQAQLYLETNNDWVAEGQPLTGPGPFTFNPLTIPPDGNPHEVAVMATASSGLKSCYAITATN